MTRRTLAPLLGIGLLFCCGCPDGSYAIVPDPDPVISFAVSPTDPEAGETVVFTLTVDAAQLVTGTRVDFEGDGT